MSDVLTALPLSLPLIAAYAIFAIGIVVIFRASKVLNIAHGAMAMVPAYFTYEMTKRGIPMAAALPAGILSGALLGVLVERVFVRPLRSVGPTAQTVGTVAALGLMVAVVGKVWGTGTLPAPAVFPEGNLQIATSTLRYGQIGLLVVMVVVTVGLTALLQMTDIGLAMRGAADNRRAAALMGVDPDVATTGAWILGGATAAIAGILLASVTLLQPLTLSLQAIPAFVAALIGGLGSLYGAVVGALIVGLLTGIVPNIPAFAGVNGLQQVVPTLLAMIVMAMRGQRYVASDIRSEL
ncbi:MAG TPA: branched-chain amino acid ABC transporter permease [Actinomycetota bacterium]|nr:branched-chain amino acid ABC transporter permease [Actinomycetota bacterium]